MRTCFESIFLVGVVYCCLCSGVPSYLEGDYIYRTHGTVHVSEFQNMMITRLKEVVGAGVEVRTSNKSVPDEADEDSKDAIIFSTSVIPCFEDTASAYGKNQTRQFNYYLPFTRDKTKAQSAALDQSWKRRITFTVEECFPCVYTRQSVISRETYEMCPIESSMDDILGRIRKMRLEVENWRPDENNMKMLLQGSVLPQVILSIKYRFEYHDDCCYLTR